MITIEEYFMGRDKTHAAEYRPAIREAALRLIERVNILLQFLGHLPVVVSSGWRPPSINAVTKGASKNSHHMTGHAVDIWDPEGALGNKIFERDLVNTKLWMEDPSKTIGWVHLQDLPPASGKRIFLP